MIVITSTGLGQVQLGFILITGYFRWLRAYAWTAFLAAAISGLLRLGIAAAAGRMRPSNFDFARPLEQVYGNTSFPSGHATTSFAIAFAVGLMVRRSEFAWVGWGMFFWAVLVAFSRVYVGVHYVSDVLGGAGLGLYGAVIAVWISRQRGWWQPEPIASPESPLP